MDFDRDACNSIRANRDWPTLTEKIEDVPTKALLKVAELRKGEPSILIGGPPCQPFSKSGYWASGDTRRLNDLRAQTLEEYMRCVREALPTVFLLENVHGIRYSGKEEGFKLLLEKTAEINQSAGTDYRLSWDVLDAADFGVPQHRQRFFLVAHREGRKFVFPKPTHGERSLDLFATSVKPLVTAWDAIGGFRPPKTEELTVGGHWGDLLPSIPEGENYLWHTNRKGGLPLFGWRTRYWSFLLKLSKRLPSWTIQAQPGPAIGPFHWDSRRLSVEELARIQTFPKRLKFVGSRLSIQKQIGNAVPSLLAEVLARAIAEQFFGVEFNTARRLAVRSKRPVPPPVSPRRVPEKYLGLVGEHSDHPGEGLGRGATRERRDETDSLLAM
jgi:DNA (cytosine-5)-methyltransferase 1